MNERIREIANHCFDVMPGDSELEQFARMILRECADLADSHTLDGTLGDIILEHFGVKL